MSKGKKKKIGIAAGVLLAVAAVVAVVLLQPAAYRLVQIIEVDGSVKLQRGQAEQMPINTEMNLQNEDKVAVEQKSYARMALDGDKYVYAEQNTNFELQAKGSEKNSKTVIKLYAGAITTEIQKPLGDNSTYEIETPNSLLAVRGTVYRVSVEHGKDGEAYTTLNVFEGKVETQLVAADGTVSKPLVVPEGKGAKIRSAEQQSQYVLEDNTVVENQEEALFEVKIEELPLQTLKSLDTITDNGEKELVFTKEEIQEKIQEQEPAASAEPEASFAPSASVEPSASPSLEVSKAPEKPKATPKRPAATPAPVPTPEIYQVTLDYGYDGQKKNLSVTAGSQLELAPPVRAGYAFQGWFYDAAFTQPVAAAFYPGASATLYAKWQAQGVEYTVEYYLENPETNTYEKDDARTARGRAETGQMVKDDAFQLSIPYYKYVTEAGSISTAIVKGDGSTVLKLYYRGRRVDVQYYAGAGRYHLMYTDYNINLAKGEYSTKGTSSAWIASSKPADKQYERVWAWCIDGGGSNGAQGILWEDNDQTKILYAAWTPMLAKYTVYYTNDPAGSTTRAPFREFSAAIGKVPTNFTLYEFDGYIPDKSRGIYVSQQPVKADGTSQYVVYYMADSYRNFRVEYYFEDAQTGKYVRDDAKTVYTTGLLDTIITAASYNSSIPGYKYSIKPGNPSQIQITTDGLVLRLYYEIDA